MAVIANTLLSHSQAANKEVVDQVVTNISPKEAVFHKMVKKVSVSATEPKWLKDSLNAPASNAHIEGNESSFDASTLPTKLSNYTQIFKKSGIVSGTQEAVETHGVDSAIGYEKVKRAYELALDREYAVVGNQAPVAGAAATARQLRPMESWITTNSQNGVGGAVGSSSAARTDGTLRTFTQALFLTAAESIYTASGESDALKLMVHQSLRKNIAAWAGFETRYIQKPGEIALSVDVLRTDFGTIEVKSNRYMRPRTAMLIDPATWQIGTLRNTFSNPVAKTGDAHKFELIYEGTLKCLAEDANAIIADLQP